MYDCSGELMARLRSVRIVGGILQLVAAQNPSDTTLAAIATGLESAGVSPLIVAAIGMLSTVCVYPIFGQKAFRR